MTVLKTLLLTFLTCLIALAGGTASALYLLDHFSGFDQLTISGWQAAPLYGSAEADPYARAQRSRNAVLPLGAAEGLRFTRSKDDQGAALDPACRYQLTGTTPPARFWTLHASDLQDRPLAQQTGLPQKLHSRMIWYQNDASFRVTIAASAQPENWLAINRNQPYQLVFVLYDTNLSSSIGFENPQMPALQLIAGSCAAGHS